MKATLSVTEKFQLRRATLWHALRWMPSCSGHPLHPQAVAEAVGNWDRYSEPHTCSALLFYVSIEEDPVASRLYSPLPPHSPLPRLGDFDRLLGLDGSTERRRECGRKAQSPARPGGTSVLLAEEILR